MDYSPLLYHAVNGDDRDKNSNDSLSQTSLAYDRPILETIRHDLENNKNKL